MLYNIENLTLYNCYKVKDILDSKYPNKIWKTQHLDLSYCFKIKNVSMFRNVNKLILRGCCNITDVKDLHSVNTLDITYCSRIKNLSILKNVKTLINKK